jgi:hypothetical protein
MPLQALPRICVACYSLARCSLACCSLSFSCCSSLCRLLLLLAAPAPCLLLLLALLLLLLLLLFEPLVLVFPEALKAGVAKHKEVLIGFGVVPAAAAAQQNRKH